MEEIKQDVRNERKDSNNLNTTGGSCKIKSNMTSSKNSNSDDTDPDQQLKDLSQGYPSLHMTEQYNAQSYKPQVRSIHTTPIASRAVIMRKKVPKKRLSGSEVDSQDSNPKSYSIPPC